MDELEKLTEAFETLTRKVGDLQIELDAHTAVLQVLGMLAGVGEDQMKTILDNARVKAAERFYLRLEDEVGPEEAALWDTRPPFGEDEEE